MIGTLTGSVTNGSTDTGIKGVKIQLINAQGKVAQTTTTNADGNYAFQITRSGPYVVHEVTPKGAVQVSPTTTKSAPAGAYVPGAGNNSYTYAGNNSIPSVGPVAPPYWSDIAPSG